jgi:glycerophosphoryl diester phosphodiesterase
VENTVGAFEAAVRLGADGVELDVRATADGAPAVHHDARLSDGRAIADLTAAELPAYVPLLDAALDACGALVVNIEIKEPRSIADAVVIEVRARNITDRVVVSSFDLATIDRVLAMDATVPTGYLVAPAHRTLAARALGVCDRHGHRAFHPHHRAIDGRLIDRAHEAGIAVHAWTVDNPARMTALAAIGVDAIVTNVPDVALRTYGR